MAVPVLAASPWSSLDADGKRRRLVTAAESVFAREGLDAPVPAIAAEAGAGVGSVYRAFASKEELVAAVAAERLHWFIGEAGSALAASDPGEAFESLLRAVVERDARDRVLASALGTAFDRPDVAPIRARAVEAGARALARAVEAGAFRADLTLDDISLLLTGVRAAERERPGAGLRLLELALGGLRN